MQQPGNLSGTQVIIVAQTAPLDTQRRYRNMSSEIAERFKLFGKAHVVIGTLCILFQVVSIGFSPNITIGHGIWIGSLFVVTGAFGIFAGKTGRKCQVITFHVLSTISAGFALLLFSLAAAYAASNAGWYYRGGAVAMEALLTLLSLAEGAVAICSSATCCALGLCCCDCGGSCCCPTDSQYEQFVNPDQPDFAQQQFMAGNQQQPVFNPNQQHIVPNTNQQRPVSNPTQLQLMFNPSQQHLVSNTNQQQLMFNPNQQQLMFIPNQQQPVFIPKQQQPMFNLSQQQLVFNPNQSMTGYYSQQLVAQHNEHHPSVLLNTSQPGLSASLPETTGQGAHAFEYIGATAGPLRTDTSTQPSGERSNEGFSGFSNSEPYPPQEPPPPYDNDSGLNSAI